MEVEAMKGMDWYRTRRADGRIEWICAHGVGHGSHIHGCDSCCSRKDYPGHKATLDRDSIRENVLSQLDVIYLPPRKVILQAIDLTIEECERRRP